MEATQPDPLTRSEVREIARAEIAAALRDLRQESSRDVVRLEAETTPTTLRASPTSAR